MPEETTMEKFSFNIEETTEIGNKEMLDNFLSPTSVKAKPEEVTDIKEDEEEEEVVGKKTTQIPQKKKEALATPKAKKEEESGKTIVDFLSSKEEGEEEDEETKEEGEEETGEETSENTETSQFQALANDLSKLGVFSLREGETEIKIDTPEDFLDRFRSEVKTQAGETIENFISQFGEDYQKAFTAIYINGVEPKEYFQTYDRIVKFAELDLTKPANQELVVKQSLLDQGWEEEDIPAKLKKIIDYGDLEEEATKAHKVLVKNESKKLQQIEDDQKRKLDEQKAIKQQFVQNVTATLNEKLKTKDFDGLPINLELARELQNDLLVEKYKTPNGEFLTQFEKDILDLKRPENHQLKVKYALLMNLLKKDPTLSSIKKKAITRETNNLFEEVRKGVGNPKSDSKKSPTSTAWTALK